MSAAQVAAPAQEASLASWMVARQAHFEQLAARALPAPDAEPQRLHAAMRYAVLDGGKRVRPLLVWAAALAVNADRAAERAAGVDAAALAVEYVHAYSLVHDDLPCMDNDVLRRGKPTAHVAFDEATALLAGDALQAEAFKALAAAPLPDGARAALMQTLAQAAGTPGMCGGQAIDLAAVQGQLTLTQLENMHRQKTGALLSAAVRMGALAMDVGVAERAALDRYSAAVGLAFQVVDDVLDVASTSAELGKTAGKDAQQGKPTYVSLLGLDAARLRAEELRGHAHAALADFGAAATRLRQLADYIVLRRH
jgi:farnesyl diphosphate synthase